MSDQQVRIPFFLRLHNRCANAPKQVRDDAARIGGEADDAIAELQSEVERLTKANKVLELKCAASLANNLCPDHRDKQTGKPCLACEIERRESCQMAWQPIETAPKNGAEFQAWLVSDDGRAWWESKCRINTDGAFEVWGRVDVDQDGWDRFIYTIKPTHWMPQPMPPAPTSGGTKRVAPWTDFNGNPIHEGDTLVHPDGGKGTVIFLSVDHDTDDPWRVEYADGIRLRLCLQIGEKGRGVVAANPDLLDACKVALGHLTGGMDGDWRECDPVELLRTAIMKATANQTEGSES